MTTNLDSQVIDLTESFTLANHSSLANAVIELDDSLVIVHDSSPQTVRPSVRLNVSMESESTQTSSRTEPRQSTSGRTESRRSSQSTRGRRPKSKRPATVAQSRLSCETNVTRTERDRSPVQVGDCPICFDRLGKNPLASTKCGHVFCVTCLEQALRSDKKCPTCRKPLRGNTAYHRLFLTGN